CRPRAFRRPTGSRGSGSRREEIGAIACRAGDQSDREGPSAPRRRVVPFDGRAHRIEAVSGPVTRGVGPASPITVSAAPHFLLVLRSSRQLLRRPYLCAAVNMWYKPLSLPLASCKWPNA